MISNPCKWWITSNKEKDFTYEGGSTLYHFSPCDNELSEYMDTNVIFLANDESHALDVLIRMFKFRIQQGTKYILASENKASHHTHEELRERAERSMSKTFKYLQAAENGKIKITKAPANQFYKVGWADNDQILNS